MKKCEQGLHEDILTNPFLAPCFEVIQKKLGLTQKQIGLMVSRAIRAERPRSPRPLRPYDGVARENHRRRVASGISNQALRLQLPDMEKEREARDRMLDGDKYHAGFSN